MVKNTKGGNKSKGFARKFLNSPSISFSNRLPQNNLELFAIVTKMYGTMCEVYTLQQNYFRCHIRGKFRGRNKRSSLISVGTIVLIGLRDFEAPHYLNTDLLEIYNTSSYPSLFATPGYDFSILFSHPSFNNQNLNLSSDPDIDSLFLQQPTPITIDTHDSIDSINHSNNNLLTNENINFDINFDDI